MKRALITGIAGSGGSHLAEYLVGNENIEVHGVSRWHSTTSVSNLKNVKNDITMHECDLNDLSATIRTIDASRPDYIFHLAAHANVHVCFSNPIAVLQNNINNTINLFEAIRIVGIDPVVQFCGTSEVYGQVEPENRDQLVIKPGQRVLVPTGLKFEIEKGYEVQVRPRSGLSLKTHLLVVNSPGTIDADYRGEVKVILGNFGQNDEVINHGDRIAQIVVAPILQVKFEKTSILSETKRGEGGFGSTGVN